MTSDPVEPSPRPWWAPDVQSILAFAIVGVCAAALFMRMQNPSPVDDKMLETMLTILFSTCLVTVYNYSFGSSRGSTAKDEAQNKIVANLTGTGNGASVPSSALVAAAKIVAPAAAAEAAPPAAETAAPPAAESAAPAAARKAVDEALYKEKP